MPPARLLTFKILSWFLLLIVLPIFAVSQEKECTIDFKSLKNNPNNEQVLHQLDSIASDCDIRDADYLTWLHLRGKACVNLARYDEALSHFQTGFSLLIEAPADTFNAIFSNQVGVVKYYLGQKKEAIRWFSKAYEIAHQNKMLRLEGFCANNVGSLYTEFNIHDSAEIFLNAALDVFDRMGGTKSHNYLHTYRILASNYESMGEIEKSNQMFREMLVIARSINDPGATANILLRLALQEAELGQEDSAIAHVNLGLQLYSLDTSQLDNVATAKEYVASVNSMFGNYETSYTVLLEAIRIRQRMFSNALTQKIGEMEATFNTETERQKRALAEAEVKASNQRMILIAIISVVFILGLIAAFFSYWQRQKTKLAEKDLQVQKGRIAAVLEGEERERTRIARDLHDGVSQLLGALKMNLSAAGLEDAQSYNLLDQGISEVRSISHNLLPKQLSKGGLDIALKQMMTQLGHSNDVNTEFSSRIESLQLSAEIQQNIFRIAQETVNNALKHAKASTIKCELNTENNHLYLQVIDDGVGLSQEKINAASGIGWKNIMARVELLQGTLSLKPSVKGTHLIFKFPAQ